MRGASQAGFSILAKSMDVKGTMGVVGQEEDEKATESVCEASRTG